MHGRDVNAYKRLVGKAEGKRRLGRPRRRCEDDIRMDARQIGWSVDLVHLAQDIGQWLISMKKLMNFWAVYNSENFLTS
jgi:hypothetical protein